MSMSGECDICGGWGCVESNHDPNPPKNAAYWKRMAKHWEASANASAKAASDNAALANRYQAELQALKRGEFICMKCGLRKDSESTNPDF